MLNGKSQSPRFLMLQPFRIVVGLFLSTYNRKQCRLIVQTCHTFTLLLFAKRDQQLFKAMCHTNHSHSHISPLVKKVCYSLRTSSHQLIFHTLKQTRCSYLVRNFACHSTILTYRTFISLWILLLLFFIVILTCKHVRFSRGVYLKKLLTYLHTSKSHEQKLHLYGLTQ